MLLINLQRIIHLDLGKKENKKINTHNDIRIIFNKLKKQSSEIEMCR